MADVGYIRVSSEGQNTERQLAEVALDEVFTDKLSGANTDREQLAACLKYLRAGDTLHVHSIDRLARNLGDLQRLVSELTDRGVSVRFHKESLTFTADQSSPVDTMLLQVLGAFAEFERSMIRERQREGIERAKAAGVYKGRKRALTAAQVAEIRQRVAAGETKAGLAREYAISRQTLYSALG